ncbi:hypothetical protein ACFL1G_08670 [Planctomycetota bacterium]
MSNISRRLNNVEKKLNLEKKPLVVIITDDSCEFPEPVEEWLTYPKAVVRSHVQNGVIVLIERDEKAARRATKSNQKQLNSQK